MNKKFDGILQGTISNSYHLFGQQYSTKQMDSVNVQHMLLSYNEWLLFINLSYFVSINCKGPVPTFYLEPYEFQNCKLEVEGIPKLYFHFAQIFPWTLIMMQQYTGQQKIISLASIP